MASLYYKLSRNEIDFIKEDVRKSQITFSHLEDELIDHLCCMVEDLVNDGYSFGEAINTMRKDVGMDTLKSIEVETIILINKKFKAMKNTMKISAIIGLSAIALSSLMRILHLPGTSFVVLFGFAALLFAYLPTLVLTLQKEKIHKRKMYLSYVGVVASSVLLLSLLFTFLNLPYAHLMHIISWFAMLVFLIMIFGNVMKSEEDRVLNLSMLLFFAVLFIVNIAFTLFDLNNPRISNFTIETNIESSIKLYENKSEKSYQQLSSLSGNSKSNEISEIKAKTAAITSRIKDIRDIIFVDKASRESYQKQVLKPAIITSGITRDMMKLETELIEYREFMLKQSASRPELNAFIVSNFQFGWMDVNNAPPVVYNNLQRLYRDIKIVENEVLSEIQLLLLAPIAKV